MKPTKVEGTKGSDTLFPKVGEIEGDLSGKRGDDFLVGGVGDDKLRGGAGTDSIVGVDGDDTIWGGNGNDYAHGGNDKDTVFGGNGQDIVFGGNGNDYLNGGDGADTITDGDGDDLMEGGEGADTFIFVADGTRDRIADFEPGTDKLDLSAVRGVGGFDDLQISDLKNGFVRIDYGDSGDYLVLLERGGALAASDIDANDFIFA